MLHSLLRLRQAGCPPVLVESAQIRHGLSQTLNHPDPALAAWVREQIAADQRVFIARWPDVQLIREASAA